MNYCKKIKPLNSNRERISSLDLMRSVAIFLVILFHYPKSQDLNSRYMIIRSYGWIGVDIFFVLSGYLISNNILLEFKKRGDFSLFRFYIKRTFRILPNYWVVVAIYFLIPDLAEGRNITPLWKFLTFTQNLGLSFSSFSHAWSLCVEEHFYLILPIFALFLLNKNDSKLTQSVFIIIVLFGVLVRWFIWNNIIVPTGITEESFRVSYYKYLYYPTYTRLDGLLFGVFISTIQIYRPCIWNRITNNYYKVLAIGIIMVTSAIILFSGTKNIHTSVFGIPLLSFGIAMILTFALSHKSFLYSIKIPFANFFATMAFSMYLTHKLVIKAVHYFLSDYGFERFNIVTTITTLVCIVLVSWLLYLCVEYPFLKIRKKILL